MEAVPRNLLRFRGVRVYSSPIVRSNNSTSSKQAKPASCAANQSLRFPTRPNCTTKKGALSRVGQRPSRPAGIACQRRCHQLQFVPTLFAECKTALDVSRLLGERHFTPIPNGQAGPHKLFHGLVGRGGWGRMPQGSRAVLGRRFAPSQHPPIHFTFGDGASGVKDLLWTCSAVNLRFRPTTLRGQSAPGESPIHRACGVGSQATCSGVAKAFAAGTMRPFLTFTRPTQGSYGTTFVPRVGTRLYEYFAIG